LHFRFIIDKYDELPGLIFFIHPTRYQWHNDDPDYDGLQLLRRVQLPYIKQRGYVNLRCVWVLGCPYSTNPLEDADESHASNAGRYASYHYKAAFEELFPGTPVPERVGSSCCAQFAVTRAKILERPKSDYERYREWILQTSLGDDISGVIMEYSWHSELALSFLCRDCATRADGNSDLRHERS